MPGALVQIIAYGSQDIYLTGNPSITFFKVSHRRHTNFAVENVESLFTGANFGRPATAEISKNSDLVTKIVARVVLPDVKYNGPYDKFGVVKFAWVKNLGHALLEETALEIGSNVIDRQYSDWLNIWSEVSRKSGHERGHNNLIGNTPDLTEVSSLSWNDKNNRTLKKSAELLIPLQFYFCRNNGLALPLIALQYHNVKVNIKFRPAEQCYIASDAFKAAAAPMEFVEASLLIDYIFLENEERQRFAKSTHEYLIEQVQHSGDESMNNGSSQKIRLSFSHPVKALYWVVKLGNYQGGKFMIYDHEDWDRAKDALAKLLLLSQFDLTDFGYFNLASIDNDSGSYLGHNNNEYVPVNPDDRHEASRFVFGDQGAAEFFDGSNFIGRLSSNSPLIRRGNNDLGKKVDGVISINSDAGNNDQSEQIFSPSVAQVTRNDLSIEDLSIPVDRFHEDHRNEFVKAFDMTVNQHDNYGLNIDGSGNPISENELHVNAQPRQTKRSGKWHNVAVPTLGHSRTPKDGINVFSFALNPEEYQPSGTCNFSRLDSGHINTKINAFANPDLADLHQNANNRFLVFAPSYNVLRFVSGMAGCAYS